MQSYTPMPIPLGRPKKDWLKHWGALMGAVVATAAVLTVLAKFFFVGKEEYHHKLIQDTTVQETMKNVVSSVNELKVGMGEISKNVADIKIDVAVIKDKRGR